jgi:Di-haem cytochrome c peroxidase
MLLRFLALSCALFAVSAPAFADPGDPPQQTIGERLFLETRFSQFFAIQSNGDANATLATGDPVMDTTVTLTGTVPGPFAGGGMNCRACHIVDEQSGAGLGNRTYCDYARRSPIPDRGDGQTVTPRNSPPLVNASLHRPIGLLFHFDGEFPSAKALTIGTMTGRNYGWLPTELSTAKAHIAHIIRDDDGTGTLAQDYDGTSYATLLKGTDSSISKDLRLPPGYRLNVARATDQQILDVIGRLVQAYLDSLVFSQDGQGIFNGTPYDAFLLKNHLPRRPAPGESDIAYGRRLLGALNRLAQPAFITDADGTFTIHQQTFTFGASELAGLKTFLRESSPKAAPQSVGNCVACHAPPRFTDFHFHNTGATQEEYDSIHGNGVFSQLEVPDYRERSVNLEAFLPATPAHPYGSGRFRSVPVSNLPGWTDLGLWNIFANPDHPASQAVILRAMTGGHPATREALLPKTIARFKTPGLRDLEDSQPYLHTGAKDTIEDVVDFYRNSSDLARQNLLRNPDPELLKINLAPADSTSLADFLRSLTEDYH